jgi:3-dehydroquinate synthase II
MQKSLAISGVLLIFLFFGVFSFQSPQRSVRLAGSSLLFNRPYLSRLSAVMSMEAWLDCASWSHSEAWDDHQKNLSFDRVLVRENQTRLIESLPVSSSKSIGIISNNGVKITDHLTGRLLGALAEVSSATGQDAALALVGSVDWIVLRCIGSWQMIPVENLIAACDGTGTKLAVFVNTFEDLPGILYSLELGPHAVILDSSLKLWDAYDTFKLNSNSKKLLTAESAGKVHEDDSSDAEDGLLTAVVTSISSGGIGDRVCIDLIQLLRDGEGLFIGSSAKLLALVHGETFEGEYVPSRPFRVNAGPVHSYVLMADGSTKYLSELKAGDSVKVVDGTGGSVSDGKSGEQGALRWRAVTVGRCKIESRPTLIVTYKYTSTSHVSDPLNQNREAVNMVFEGQIFLQQAETVRLICPITNTSTNTNTGATEGTQNQSQDQVQDPEQISGAAVITHIDTHMHTHRAIPVTEIKIGDEIYVLKNSRGTHVGNRVTATVVEK